MTEKNKLDDFFRPTDKCIGDFLRHCDKYGFRSRFGLQELSSRISTILLRRLGTLNRRAKFEGRQEIIVKNSFSDEMSSAISDNLKMLKRSSAEVRDREEILRALAAEFCEWHSREGRKIQKYDFLRTDADGNMYIVQNCQ